MAKKRQRAFALFAAGLFLVSSVALSGFVLWQMYQQSKQSPAQKAQQEQQQQQQQASSKGKPMDNFQPTNTAVTELQKTDIVVGTGDEVKAGDVVLVNYVGATVKDGKIFDASSDHGQAVPITLVSGPNGVIDGWVQGVPGMKVGGKRRLLIPAKLAYADQSPDPSIPPNSDLVFDIEALQIQPKQQ